MASVTGTLTLAKSYQPFGSVLSSAGVGASNYGFTGEWTDATGLIYLRARYYAPGQGRFISADPWGGDPNRPMSYNKWLYAYANPIRLSDPTGLRICEEEVDCGLNPPPPPPPPSPLPLPPPSPVVSQPPPDPAVSDPVSALDPRLGEPPESFAPALASSPNASPIARPTSLMFPPEDDPMLYVTSQQCGPAARYCVGLGTNPGRLETPLQPIGRTPCGAGDAAPSCPAPRERRGLCDDLHAICIENFEQPGECAPGSVLATCKPDPDPEFRCAGQLFGFGIHAFFERSCQEGLGPSILIHVPAPRLPLIHASESGGGNDTGERPRIPEPGETTGMGRQTDLPSKGVSGIYEFWDQERKGWYVGGTPKGGDIRDRLTVEMRQGRIESYEKVVWTEIPTNPEWGHTAYRLAEKIRIEQVAGMLGGRENTANPDPRGDPMSHPVYQRLIQEGEYYNIPGWPDWLYGPPSG